MSSMRSAGITIRRRTSQPGRLSTFLTMRKYQNDNWYVFFLSTDSRYVYDDGNSSRLKEDVVESLIRKHNNHIPLYNIFNIRDDVGSDSLYREKASNRSFLLYFPKMDAITSCVTSIKESLDKHIGTDYSMRDIKRYETFFRPKYSYETLKENEK